MASFARISVLCSLVLGCSPKVIDAVVEGTCCGDGGGETGTSMEASAIDSGGDAAPDASARRLIHRFSFFNGQPGQTVVQDSMQTGPDARLFDAHLYNVQFTGDPFLALPGGSAATAPAYVDLPNFLISRLEQVTIEAWVNWAADSDPWQRVFDFGEDFSGADIDAAPRVAPADDPRGRDGRSYLYLTPMSGGLLVPSVLRVAYLKPEDMVPRMTGVTTRETAVTDTTALGAGLHQLAVTIDANLRMSLYVDGTHIGVDQVLPGRLADIYDVNCWIGRSQFPVDATFHGNVYEFRIYSVALTQAQILSNKSPGYSYMVPAIQ